MKKKKKNKEDASTIKKKIKKSFKDLEEKESLSKDSKDKELKKELDEKIKRIKEKIESKGDKLDSLEKDYSDKKKLSSELESKEEKLKEKMASSKKNLTSLKDLLADSHKKTFEHRSLVLGSKINEISFNLKNAQSLDILFMMDSTGSMALYITETKNVISKLVKETKSAFPEAEIRVAMLAYRDITDKNRFEKFEFSKSIDEFENFVGKLCATGGGDTAEDINGALQKAIEFNWESATRILFHIADAPCHNKIYHNGVIDDYPEGYSGDVSFESLFEKLLLERILYVVLNVNETLTKMIQKFREHFVKLKKYFIEGVTPFHFRPLNNEPKRLYSSLISSVYKSMSSSIISSLSSTTDDGVTLKSKSKYKLDMTKISEESESDYDDRIPKWDTESEDYWKCEKGVDLVSMEIPKNDELLKDDLYDYKTPSNLMSNQEIFLHFPQASEGSFNKTYYAKMNLKHSGIKKMMAKFPKNSL